MNEYYNKEYYNQIKGNCAFIELNPDNVKKVMRALYDSGINFSAVYGGYRNTVTVSKEDEVRARTIANEHRGVNRFNQRVIGNTDYRSIKDKNYINTTPEIALQVSAILSGDSKVSFSGVIKEKSATLTVSGAKNAETVNRIIDNIRNADILNAMTQAGFERLSDNNGAVVIRNNATGEVAGFRNMNMVRDLWNDSSNEFFHAPVFAVDKAEENDYPFYLSDTDGQNERNVFVEENMSAPMFPTEEAAVNYAENNNIPMSQADVADNKELADDSGKTPYEILLYRARAELERYEKSLDTVDKALAAAFELSAKRNILAYIDSYKFENLMEGYPEGTIERFIESENPLDLIFSEWTDNENGDITENLEDTVMDVVTNTFGVNMVQEETISGKDNTETNEMPTEDSPIHFGLLGNGITVYDTSREVDHDYPIVAHISEEGVIRYYEKENIGEDDIRRIEEQAAQAKEKFTEYWNKLEIAAKYHRIMDSLTTDRYIAVHRLDLDVSDLVKEFERSVIFKDEPFPDINAIREKYAPEQDNSASTQEEPKNETAPEYRDVPLYTDSFEYAREADEIDLFRISREENEECARAIDKYSTKFYNDYRYDSEAVLNAVLAEFPADRVEYVVAANIAQDNDGRISRANIEWAENYMKDFSDEYRKLSGIYLKTHKGLLNMFAETVRKYMENERDVARVSEKVENRIKEVEELRQQFADKIKNDLDDFLAEPKEDVSEYQVNIKKDFADFIINNDEYDLSETQYKALLSSPDALSEIYYEWLKLDTDEWDEETLTTLISDTADLLVRISERENSAPAQGDPALAQAKAHIREYLDNEFDSEETFKNLRSVSIGYTELGDNNEYPFQAEADLVEYNINFYLDNQIFKTLHYDSLEEMNEFLDGLNFDDVVAYGNEELDNRNPDEVSKALDLYRNHITFSVIRIEGEEPVVSGTTYVDSEDIADLDEYQDFILKTGKKYADVTVEYYDIGNDEGNESYPAEDGEANYIQAHLTDVINHTGCILLETNSLSVQTPEHLLEEYAQAQEEKGILPNGRELISDDDAVAMWEHGVTIYDYTGEAVTPMPENEDEQAKIFAEVFREYGRAADLFSAKSEDVAVFRIADTVAANIGDMSRSTLSLESNHSEWTNYKPAFDEYRNTLDALYSGNYISVEKYLENIIAMQDIDTDTRETAEKTLAAVSDFREQSKIPEMKVTQGKTVDELETGDRIRYNGEEWTITRIDSDFSLSLDNVDPNANLQASSIWGRWKEKLTEAGFEYIPKETAERKNIVGNKIDVDTARQMWENGFAVFADGKVMDGYDFKNYDNVIKVSEIFGREDITFSAEEKDIEANALIDTVAEIAMDFSSEYVSLDYVVDSSEWLVSGYDGDPYNRVRNAISVGDFRPVYEFMDEVWDRITEDDRRGVSRWEGAAAALEKLRDILPQYLGRDSLTAYYYFPNGFSNDSLWRIRQQSGEYAVAAPTLALSEDFMRESNIHFYKVGRDIHESFANFYEGNSNSFAMTKMYDVLSDKHLLETAKALSKAAGKPFTEFTYDEVTNKTEEEFDRMKDLFAADIFQIYQVKNGEEYHFKRFAAFAELKEDEYPNISDYDLVYTGNISDYYGSGIPNEFDSLFMAFNLNRPRDYTGRSMSTSDVLVLHGDTPYYVDGIGYKMLDKSFLIEKETPEKMTEQEAVEKLHTESGVRATDFMRAMGVDVFDGDNLPEKDDSDLSDINIVTPEMIGEVIETREPRDIFLAQEGDRWVGVDNRTGDAWTEDFGSKDEAVRWLRGDDRAEIDIMLDLKLRENNLKFSVITIDGEKPFVVDGFAEKDEAAALDEVKEYLSSTGNGSVDVKSVIMTIGTNDKKAREPDDTELEYISEHLDDVLSYKSVYGPWTAATYEYHLDAADVLPEKSEYRSQVQAIYEYENAHNIPEAERLTKWYDEQNVSVAKPSFMRGDVEIGISDTLIAARYNEIMEERSEKAEPYEPKLGDKFIDKRGEEWELTSLTGVLPWYTDQCAIRSISGGFAVEKNETYTKLLDPAKYTRVADVPEINIAEDEITTVKVEIAKGDIDELREHLAMNGYYAEWDGNAFLADEEEIDYIRTVMDDRNITYTIGNDRSEYTPKIGDMIDINDSLLTITDISGELITFTDSETLFAEQTRMTFADFYAQEFTVVNEVAEADEPAEDIPETTPKADVPLEHNEQTVNNSDITIKNLAQLKRALTVGAEFRMTNYNRSGVENQLRRVNYADTTGFYTICPDAPDDEKFTNANNGRGSYLEWGKSGDWNFSGATCTLYAKGKEHTEENRILSLTVTALAPVQEKSIEENAPEQPQKSEKYVMDYDKGVKRPIDVKVDYSKLSDITAENADSIRRSERRKIDREGNDDDLSRLRIQYAKFMAGIVPRGMVITNNLIKDTDEVPQTITPKYIDIPCDTFEEFLSVSENPVEIELNHYKISGRTELVSRAGATFDVYVDESNPHFALPLAETKPEKSESERGYTYDENDPDKSKVLLRSVTIDLTPKRERERQPKQQPEQQTSTIDSDFWGNTDYLVDSERGQNYVITDENLGAATPKVRYRANIEAIKVLKEIEHKNLHLASEMIRPQAATPEQQAILAKYTGWGAIPEVFDASKSDWSKEYEELKEILTEEEYAAARKSTLNAHFTSPVVIDAIYRGLAGIGFKQGDILEPAMGIGNFFGAMPESMRGSELHGVELDSITGRIARQLYPTADVQVKGFEQTRFKNDSFDVVVGNVPFGDYKVDDKDYNKHKFLIHDYFIAKAMDKVRPGGIVAVVTSKGTMDKENSDMRKYIAQRAELLGAIRLPNTAFKANAGTEVTSDILFFQKRERPIEINPAEVEWLNRAETENGLLVNNYFVQHPEMVLGRIVEGNKMYGTQQGNTSCEPIEGADLKTQLAEAVKNIKGTYTAVEKKKSSKEIEDVIPAPPDSRIFSYYAVDGIVYFRDETSDMTRVNLKGESLKKALAMIEIRDNVRELLDLQLNNADHSLDRDIEISRNNLNVRYDAFVAKYGHFDDKKNTRVLKGDDGYNFLLALEDKDKDGNYTKAAIFDHDTVKPNVAVSHVETAGEALILSVAERAKVDFEYMTELCGLDKDALIRELEGQIFRLPQEDEVYVTADEYLTGNIRTKLRELNHAPEGMDVSKHREALEAAMPKKVEAKDITVKLGAHWVAPKYVAQFINEKLNPSWRSRVEVYYSKASGRWKIEGMSKSDKQSYSASKEFGTGRKNAYEIIEGILNHDDLTVKDVKLDEFGEPVIDSKGKYVKVTNQEETKAVQTCVRRLENEWTDWIFRDPDRRADLVERYNEIFNSIRHREYDGSHLRFVGMNTEIKLREHQKNAVARGLYGPNTLLAHCVGAGKTYVMIAIAMEGKRLGLHDKALFAVPNALTEQFGRDFRKLYPAANVLVATKKDFEPKNRKKLFARIATGEWDAVIVGHSQLDRMGLSAERAKSYLEAEIATLRQELEEAESTDGKKSFSVKQIEKTIAKYEKKLKEITEKIEKDGYISIEEMGLNALFLDECHMYKNLATATKMSNVAGITVTGSAKSAGLLMLSKYFDEITGGRGQTYASGTPVSNSMTELYTTMRYLQSELLKQCDIAHFDEWAADFGEVKTDYELKPESDGKYQLKTRFAKFTNLPELMGMFKECADIRTADTLDLEKPESKVIDVVAEPSKIQKRLIKSLSKRASKIREGNVDPREDNMLCITNDGRKIGLDQRLMIPGCPDEPTSKVNKCIDNVFRIWQDTAENRSTQLVFCDMSTPKQPDRQDRFEIYRPGEEGKFECIRRKVGLGKAGTKNAIGTFDDVKAYVDKAAADSPEDKLQTGDIAVFRVPSEDGKTIESRAAIFMGGKFVEEDSPELLEKLYMSPVEDMPPKTFNVYDDIKDKLIARGVPEQEIAFIHDYDTAEKKQALFEQMNRGEVRVLIGSTAKCGAGMNVQEKLIALHHLDCPLRPADVDHTLRNIIKWRSYGSCTVTSYSSIMPTSL